MPRPRKQPTPVKISDLSPDRQNANRGTDRGRTAVRLSLETSGAGRSILLDKNNQIIAGNKTAEAAIGAGMDDLIIVETTGNQLVAVKRTDIDLDSPEGRSLAIADNRTAELGLDWDPAVLMAIAKDTEIPDTLWDKDEWAAIESAAQTGNPPGPKEPPPEEDLDELKNAPDDRVKLGELWQLGRHRLICGDSTDKDTIDRLLDGRIMDLCLTDPPYNVAYNPEDRVCTFGADRIANPLGTIKNDSMSNADFRAFLDAVYSRINDAIGPGCPIYIFHADMEGHNFRGAFVAQPWKMQACLIWAKNHFAFGRNDYHWKHEPILYGWKEGAPHRYYGGRDQTTLLDYKPAHYDKGNSDTEGYVHSCQKPTPLLCQLINNSSKQGDAVLDLFGGSGSTLIAADQCDRDAYLAELDPRFASVIVARWENYTGGTAKKIS